MTVDTIEQANQLRREVTSLFGECSMVPHKWCASRQLFDSDKSQSTVLGVNWDHIRDELFCKFNSIAPVSKWTFKEALMLMGKMYDPIGILSPVTTSLRVLVQRIQRVNRNLKDEVDIEFSNWLDCYWEMAKQHQLIRVKRNTTSNPQNASLAVFCDASEDSYGAVVYVVDHQTGKSTFMWARGKVVPFKPKGTKSSKNKSTLGSAPDMPIKRSIAEIELQAAVMGAEMYDRISKLTGIKSGLIYSDSNTTLAWIERHVNSLKVFVRNRVQLIHSFTHLGHWKRVDTSENPADIITRRCTIQQLANGSKADLWVNGPKFLKLLRRDEFFHPPAPITNLVANSKINYDQRSWEQILNEETVELGENGIKRLMRMRYLELIRRMQQDSFGQEIDDLKREQTFARKSKLGNIKVEIDPSGILRALTRVQTGTLDTRQLIVLDGKHKWAFAWTMDHHINTGHWNERNLINHIKERHYVFDLRSVIRKVIAKCEFCRREGARPGKTTMGLLPTFRTEVGIPFTSIGIDFFGPILNSKGQKRYGLLATCAVTRGVHVELVQNESTASVYEGLRRVFARRGRPSLIYSDNGRSFVRMSKDLKCLFDRLNSLATSETQLQAIEWRFSSPFAPWQGGFFERMVGTFKRALHKLSKSHSLPDNELTTLFAEAEAVVNSRPLGIADDGEPISPGCFWLGRSPISLPACGNKAAVDLPATLEAYKKYQRMLNGFWANWSKCYLTNLRDRYQKVVRENPIKIGMKVLIINPTLQRDQWEVGTVVDQFEAGTNPGKARNFLVEINGTRKRKAIQSLAPLEADLDEVERRENNQTAD